MLGWKIFKHAVMMVVRNIQDILKIGLFPYALGFTAFLLFLFLAGNSPDVQLENLDPSGLWSILPGFLVLMFCSFWVLVRWHRFVLLEEMPTGWISGPPPQVWGYVGRLIGLFLLGVFAVVPMWIIAIILSAIPGLLIPVLIVYLIFLGLLFFRLSIILPAVAIGRPLKLSEAFAQTEGQTGTFVVLVLALIGVQILVQIVAVIFGLVPLFGVFIALAASIFVSLVNVSVLTTLYGVFIEEREL